MVTSHRRSSSEPGQTPAPQRAEGRLPTIAGRFDPYDLPWGDGGSNEPIRPKPSKPSSGGNRKGSQGPRGDARFVAVLQLFLQRAAIDAVVEKF